MGDRGRKNAKSRQAPAPRENTQPASEDDEAPVVSGKRKRQVSEKQSHADKENVDALLKKIDRLSKQLKSQSKKRKKTLVESEEDDEAEEAREKGSDIESEDEDDVPPQTKYQTIKSLGVVANVDPRLLRREDQPARTASIPQAGPTVPPQDTSHEIDVSEDVTRPGKHSSLRRTSLQSPTRTPSRQRSRSAHSRSSSMPRHSPPQRRSSLPRSSSRQRASSPYRTSSRSTTHFRGRSSSPVDRRTMSSAPREDTHHNQEQDESTEPGFKNGRIPEGSPKADDYEPHVKRIILRAIEDFQCMVCTSGAFPSPDTSVRWAREAWATANSEAEQNYRLTDRIMFLIRSRTSHARSTVRDKMRPHVVNVYGFIKNSESAAVANITIYKRLLEHDRFHYKDIDKLDGFAQNKVLLSIIGEEWFRRKNDSGIRFESRFRPFKPELFALLITIAKFCISEFRDGTFSQGQFTEKGWEEEYSQMLVKVREWRRIKPEVVDKIWCKIYDRLRKQAGAGPSTAACGLSEEAQRRAREELEGRTGDTDSENETPPS